MRNFSYSAPDSLPDALRLLGPSVRPLAGGTDLVTLMKADLAAPQRLVSIRRLVPREIVADDDGLALGAGATLAELERHAGLARDYGALAQAAAVAASPQLRNIATLGGNLLQRPRCWYFRNARVPCWLKGGEHCPARDGENRLHALFGASPCVAVHPSDLAPALLALDAVLGVRSAQGEATMTLEQFFAVPEEGRRSETRLAEDALLLSVRLPALGTRSVYLKAMDRAAFSFALVSVAAAWRLSADRRIEHVRVVLGGVAPVPWRSQAAERALLGAEPDDALFEAAAAAALESAVPLRRNAWKIPLARALVGRALRALV